MPVPPNAKLFPDPLDPKDRVEFLVNLDGVDGVLETGELVDSYTVTATPEAVALGLMIGTTTYAPTQPTPTQIMFWLEVDDAFQSDAAFDGAGTVLGVEITIDTDALPSRRRQRTAAVTVAQQ